MLPTIAVQFDDVISKPVLTKNDDFKDYINKDSKVRYPDFPLLPHFTAVNPDF